VSQLGGAGLSPQTRQWEMMLPSMWICVEEDEVFLALSAGWWLGSILLFIIWILIAFWPARVARRKGHSFILFFIFSLFFFPLALLVAYLVRDRRR
jgi:hypothetical protein